MNKIKITSPTAASRRRTLVQQAHNPNGVTVGEIERQVAQVSGFVKLLTGVANNAALMIILDALNKIADVRSRDSYKERPYQPHPKYRHQVKHLFNQVLKERDLYRRALLYAGGNNIRFFRVSDMPEETRRKYGKLTDAEYFEFWEGTGSLAYHKSQPLIGSLHNKFRLSLQNHGVPYPEQTAWGLVGANVLELAVIVWQRAMKSATEAFGGLLQRSYIEQLYRPFSLHRVSKTWLRALEQLCPEASTYPLDPTEERNITLGVEQIMELWVSPDLPFDAAIKTVEDFSEDLFSTQGHAKKAMHELAEMRNEAVEDLRQRLQAERIEAIKQNNKQKEAV